VTDPPRREATALAALLCGAPEALIKEITMHAKDELGPLFPLVGTWEGDDGVDVAFSHEKGEVIETPFFERTTFNSFGPVDNGRQVLYGLDYRTAAWKDRNDDPFHTEVGYWLWDSAASQVMRCFMIPRGVVLIAGGSASADSTTLTMSATAGDEDYGILSNQYLLGAAKTTAYHVTLMTGSDSFTYNETTVVEMTELGAPLDHTDRNTLRKISE
jgi:hypothetical protein